LAAKRRKKTQKYLLLCFLCLFVAIHLFSIPLSAQYVHKTALSSSRLLACDERTVTFQYRDRKSGQNRVCRLAGEEFLRRYLQHVLPQGCQRVRSYGWMSPAAIRRWQRIHSLLHWTAPSRAPIVPPPPILCPCCHKPMRLVGTFPRSPPLRYS